MAISTQLRFALNRILARGNMQIGTLTTERAESARLERLRSNGHFERPVYPLPDGVLPASYPELAGLAVTHRAELEALHDPARNSVGYTPRNGFFVAPDSVLLYLMMRRFRPAHYFEIGCGNSTRIARQAIRDGALDTRIVAIDPAPRIDVANMVDDLNLTRLEDFGAERVLQAVGPGDILFIDSSHEVSVGNDVVTIFLNVLPVLPAGVIVHVHDIFLPFEYPAGWVIDQKLDWGEQYLLHLLLQTGRFNVLWPGYAAQRMQADETRWLPDWANNPAQSFWMISR